VEENKKEQLTPSWSWKLRQFWCRWWFICQNADTVYTVW